jgi:lipopolysaccharide assembly outer membrane protein LptD (OstA)
MKQTKAIILAILAAAICAFFAASILAQEQSAATAPKQKEVVSIDGDKWKWKGGDKTSVYTITGNVIIKQGDTTVTATKAEYDEKAKIAVIDGGVKIVDPENQITGDKATTYLNDRKNVVEGNVKMIGIPKTTDTGKDAAQMSTKLREPTTITCDKLEYLYRKKIATISGHLKIVQKDRTLVGEHAVYDVNQQVVTLTGGVHVTDEKGQTFTSPGEIRASLKEGSEWIESGTGSATLHVNIDEEKEPEKSPDKNK